MGAPEPADSLSVTRLSDLGDPLVCMVCGLRELHGDHARFSREPGPATHEYEPLGPHHIGCGQLVADVLIGVRGHVIAIDRAEIHVLFAAWRNGYRWIRTFDWRTAADRLVVLV